METQPKILILRGIPGSGKTTFARLFFKTKGWEVVSADDYFIDIKDGKYKFDGSKIGAAHDWCFALTVRYIKAGKNVVVDNTNRTVNEFKRYLSIPDVIFMIYRVVGDFGSTKNIPDHTMELHRTGFQPYEGLVRQKEVRLFKEKDGTYTFQSR